MQQAQTLMGLHREDTTAANDAEDTGIYFYSPRPDVASPGFQTLTRDANFNWVGQGRLSRDQAMQFTGSGEETVSLEGRLYPHLFGGLKTLDRLREEGAAGARFIISRYFVMKNDAENDDEVTYEYNIAPIGLFGIRRVRAGELRIGNTGLPDVMDFVLELVKLGQDAGDGTTDEFFYAARERAQAEAEGRETTPVVGAT